MIVLFLKARKLRVELTSIGNVLSAPGGGEVGVNRERL